MYQCFQDVSVEKVEYEYESESDEEEEDGDEEHNYNDIDDSGKGRSENHKYFKASSANKGNPSVGAFNSEKHNPENQIMEKDSI